MLLLRSSIAPGCCHAAAANSRLEGRYSYSLTTFDPHGRLGQVERAAQAAALGVPLIAVIVDNNNSNNNTNDDDDDDDSPTILLAAPQRLPSPLMWDDGTARWVRLTSQLVVAHTGLSADGRVVMAAAQRAAVQHEYTYGEEMPVALVLEELALLWQESTVQPAVRPLGVSLIVAYVPKKNNNNKRKTNARTLPRPRLFGIDASGAVSDLGPVARLNLEPSTPPRRQPLHDFLKQLTTTTTKGESLETDEPSISSSNRIDQLQDRLAALLRDALEDKESNDDDGDSNSRDPSNDDDDIQDNTSTEEEDSETAATTVKRTIPQPKTTILTAQLSPTRGFSMQRYEQQE